MFRERSALRAGSTENAGRLSARPGRAVTGDGAVPPEAAPPVGVQSLKLAGGPASLLYVPPGYRAEQPMPLAVMLHGAGGTAEQGLGQIQQFADEYGIMLLAPASRRASWDFLRGGPSLDVAGIDIVLADTFARYAVDPAHVAIGGFSDGASYALTLGIINGDLFSHVIAFAPGFTSPGTAHGAPRIFVAHGTQDRTLPIDVCSRRIVPRLREAGYDVVYHEFDGPHTIPPEIAHEAVEWFVNSKGR